MSIKARAVDEGLAYLSVTVPWDIEGPAAG